MPIRTSLFVDKITFTLPIENSKRSSVALGFEGLVAQDIVEPETNRFSGLLKAYRRAYILGSQSTGMIFFQIDPHVTSGGSGTPSRSFMRVEWNPNKCPSMGLVSLIYVLGEVIPDFSLDEVLSRMNLTRVDFSFDLYGIHIESLCIFSTLRKTYIKRHSYGPSGTVNSIEFGKKESDRYLLVYNKALHLTTAQIALSSPGTLNEHQNCGTLIRRTRNRTRFELRLHDIGTLEKLARTPNPFSIYTVRQWFNLERELYGHRLIHFLDSCRQRGMQGALSLIANRRERTAYVSAIREVQPPAWWEPAAIWEERHAAIAVAFSHARYRPQSF